MSLNSKKRTIVLCIFILVSLGVIIYRNVFIITPLKCSVEFSENFGIIDGNLSFNHNNLALMNSSIKSKEKTHGDQILEFLQFSAPNCSFYYYDVETSGSITSESILEGLKWMLQNDIQYVSISLSSKYYSSDLEEWITKHSNEIKVYASYNNLANTLDYPAKYQDVIGVGSSTQITPKKNDIILKNNKIILLSAGIKFYDGNSFLTPYIMLKDNFK